MRTLPKPVFLGAAVPTDSRAEAEQPVRAGVLSQLTRYIRLNDGLRSEGFDAKLVVLSEVGHGCDGGGQMLKISYSAGWADYIPGESPEDLLRRADEALYVNKRLGKGRDKPSVVPA